jgi:hypothetical protein
MRETRAGHHDDVGGAGRMKARCVLMNITDLANVGARDPSRFPRAPSGPRQLRKTRPQGCKPQDTSEGSPCHGAGRRFFAPSERMS